VDTDFSVDIVMESKGMITTDGWTLEVAIPFKSLRYEAGKGKQWGIHIWRNIDRFNDEIDSWMPNSRDISSLLSQEGHLTGLEGISTERTWTSFRASAFGNRKTREPLSVAQLAANHASGSRKNANNRSKPDPPQVQSYSDSLLSTWLSIQTSRK
jgi:hypothetical protein